MVKKEVLFIFNYFPDFRYRFEIKKCAEELLCISNDEDFLINNRTPSEIREIYNLSENDYGEVMDHIRSTLFEHR